MQLSTERDRSVGHAVGVADGGIQLDDVHAHFWLAPHPSRVSGLQLAKPTAGVGVELRHTGSGAPSSAAASGSAASTGVCASARGAASPAPMIHRHLRHSRVRARDSSDRSMHVPFPGRARHRSHRRRPSRSALLLLDARRSAPSPTGANAGRQGREMSAASPRAEAVRTPAAQPLRPLM